MSRWKVPEHFKVILGGNTYIDCPVLINYQGQSLFELRRSERDGYLGINFDVYGSNGKRLGTVRNCNFVPPAPKGYTVESEMDHYTLVEDDTGRMICDIRLRSEAPEEAEIDVAADMYMPNGFLLRLTPDETNAGGMTLKGNTFHNCGSAVRID
jgi:hypothetical protein